MSSADHAGNRVSTPGPFQAAQDQRTAHAADFIDFYRRHVSEVEQYLRRTGIDASLAQDATQDAFVSVWTRWDQIRELERPEGYVYTVARRNSLRHMRLREVLTPDPGALILAASSNTEEDFRDEGDEEDVRRMVRQLPPAQAKAISLAMEGHTPQEISGILNVEPATVRSNIRHARKKIAALLANSRDDDIARLVDVSGVEDVMRRAAATLDSSQQQTLALLLQFQVGVITMKDVAAELGVSEYAAKMAIHRMQGADGYLAQAVVTVYLAENHGAGCAGAARIVGGQPLSPRLRATVTAHVRSCVACQDIRRKIPSAIA